MCSAACPQRGAQLWAKLDSKEIWITFATKVNFAYLNADCFLGLKCRLFMTEDCQAKTVNTRV